MAYDARCDRCSKRVEIRVSPQDSTETIPNGWGLLKLAPAEGVKASPANILICDDCTLDAANFITTKTLEKGVLTPALVVAP